MRDVEQFLYKMKYVFTWIEEDEIDTYNELYTDDDITKFITWINKRYEELTN